MTSLTTAFEVHTRDDVVSLCRQIANAIRLELISHPERENPIIIAVSGEDNSGKSLIWDAVREALFKHGGIFIPSKSESSQRHPQAIVRSYESWIGEIGNNGQEHSLFVCNVGQLFYDYMGQFHVSHIANPMPDIIIVSKTCDTFIPAELHTFEIDMGSPEKWHKTIKVTSKDSSYLNLQP